MATKPTTEVRSATSQRDNRWLETVYDQHKSPRFPRGRPWWGYLEIPADPKQTPAFCNELSPGDHNDPGNSIWSAPWVPDQVTQWGGRGYFRLDVKRLSITWLYSAIIEDYRQANINYYEAAAVIAHQKGWPAPGLNEPVSFQIHSILRAPPLSHKIPEAALAGDPWILGYTSQVNEELAGLLKGVRVLNDLRPVVTPEEVLGGGADIQARIDAAVAAALEARDRANREKMAKARAARKSSPATQSAA